jgi:glycosyltransferase involved in cell wall biosynthesis
MRAVPRLCIVIPCYNAAETIAVQLSAIAAQRCDDPFEVIVADNGSTDRSRQIAESFKTKIPALTVVDASQKRGAAHARNVGAAAARGTFLLFCDADDEMAPGYLEAMSAALQHADFVAARYDYRRLNSSWLAAVRPGGQSGEPMGGFCHPTLPYAGGGGLGVKKALHDAVGGFDTTLRAAAGQEDTDYCIRIQLAGAPLRYAPEALMHIRVKTGIRGVFLQAKAWAESGAYICRRYQPESPQADVRSTVFSLGKHLGWRVLHLRSRADLAQLIWQAGWSVGWVEAMLRMRGHLDGAPADRVSS